MELTLTANLALWNTNQVKQNKIQNFSWKFRLLKRFVKRCYRDGWTTQMASCNGRRRHEIPFWRQKTSPKSISIATSIFVKVRLRNVFIIIPAHELFSLQIAWLFPNVEQGHILKYDSFNSQVKKKIIKLVFPF